MSHHKAAAYRERACLPVCVQGTSFPSLRSLEVVHAKFRTYQIETQNSGWIMNARVRGCLLARCFLPPEPTVCLPVIVLCRFLNSSVGMFKVERALTKGCTILAVSASVQRHGTLSNLILLKMSALTAEGLD